MRRLHELKPGTKAIVLDVEGNTTLKRKLLGMGLTRGAEVRIVRNAPLKDPMEIEVRRYRLTLRKAEAEKVIVEVRE
ncbi:FeoA family protein [Archaeoglobus profundus]|uniref:FeoA family protein n=1 Tax=Archaeoglobus profundus (strain DSM 5631 / JCM 9629 / NBRC 100127 / Av18) TaxID=572546 RepID=D2RG01_ARCPA|nr:ferrous iron transport protein A [Archaeoglobus profundus]ADB57226.1 FeoA family protein [Archaeoglobus profundus DSM 5631]